MEEKDTAVPRPGLDMEKALDLTASTLPLTDDSADPVLMRLLSEIHDLGTQDIYTDADEYGDRVDGMEGLVRLLGKFLSKQTVTLVEIDQVVPEEEDDSEDRFCSVGSCYQEPQEDTSLCIDHTDAGYCQHGYRVGMEDPEDQESCEDGCLECPSCGTIIEDGEECEKCKPQEAVNAETTA